MSKVSIFDQGWTDLVFEGRNKSYGAYQLRRENPKTTIIALITGIALLIAAVSIPVMVNYFKAPQAVHVPSPSITEPITPVELEFLKKPEPPKPEPLVQQAPAAKPASSTPQVKFTTPVVTSATPDDLPTQDDLDNANPGSVNDPGDGLNNIAIGASGTSDGEPGGTGTANEDTGNSIEIAGTLDEAPAYPGGLEAFYKKVGREFNAPRTERKATLKVFVSFVVEKDGSMTNIRAVNDPGYGMGKEAIRVLQSIKTKWKPGKKNGKTVRTAYSLPITVNVN